jgi:Flp pilus assembly protein TadG
MKLFKGDRRGSVMLEFVAACMLVLLIWAGVCNLALILKDRLVVAASAREAGRTAAVTGDAGEGERNGYQMLAAGNIYPGRATVVVRSDSPQLQMVSSRVTCRTPVAVPGLMLLFGGSPWEKELTVSDSAVFVEEPD